MKALRAELKLNETQMKGTGESTDTLEKREKLLQKELEASGQKVELLTGKMEAAKAIFGENSIEANNWSAKLADAKRAQEAISQELSQTSAKLEEQKNAETQLSAEQLKAAEEARKQAEAEEQLKAAVGQTDNKIQELDQELQLNETKLEGAKNKTDLLKERQKLLGQESKAAADKTKILQDALDECAREVGEDSEKYAELKAELMDSKIKQEEIRNEIKKTSEELKNQKTAIQTFGEGLGKFGEGTEKVGQNLKVVSTAAAGALGTSGAAAIQFESAFAGVKKTSDEVFDANGKCVYSYQQLEDGIRSMAKEIPASTTEISEVAEAAGQLGIKTQDVLGFTRVMIDMGNSTNLSAEDAATSIAKFANITGLAADTSMSADEKYKKMGSTIVDLGNNYATTEADIMNMATNLASAGTQVGMSESDILALATALSSVGMEAQAGGTAFSKALIEMQLAVETNSDSLKDWKNLKARELCIPSFCSTLFGISEPAIFGVNLRYKFPLIGGCIGGAVAGAYVYYSKLTALGFGTTALPGMAIANPAHHGYINYIIAHAIAIMIGFVCTVIFGKMWSAPDKNKNDKKNDTKENDTTKAVITEEPGAVYAAAEGTVKDIEASTDPTFANKVLGDGVVIFPEDGTVMAPCKATVSLVYPTGHAIGLTTADGAEILIHCGVDTVNMNGEGFETLVKEGQEVTAEEALIRFDIDLVKKHGYSPEILVIFTELPEGKTIKTEEKHIAKNDKMAEIV